MQLAEVLWDIPYMQMNRENQLKLIDEGIEHLGITQHRLEKMAGVPVGSVKDLRRGKRSMASEKWQKIQDVLAGKELSGEISDAEVALTDAVKDILQILLYHKLATPESLNHAFSAQYEDYQEKNLPNAMTVMRELKSFVVGEPRQPEREIIRKLLQLSPLGSA